jgi:AraC-like DNA-binding protein
MSALNELLRSLEARGSTYFCDRLEHPWKMDFKDRDDLSFHYVKQGECWLHFKGKSERLVTGDLVFVGQADDHVLASTPARSTSKTFGSSALLLCGYFKFGAFFKHPLLRTLPRIMIVHEEDLSARGWLKHMLDQMTVLYRQSYPGSEVVNDKLSEVLLVELIRLHAEQSGSRSFSAALHDRQIGRALELIHLSPEKPWTLESLGKQVGMSRSAFSNRFHQLVDETVFTYLTELRIRRASELLRATGLPIFEIASQVGYQSDLAFARIFKKQTGKTPFAYRRANSRTH